VAKLRAPAPARRTLITLGVTVPGVVIRAFATIELGLGLAAALTGARPAGVALAVLYAGFAALAALLARRQVACGCFGDSELPASGAQVAMSVVLALLSLAATLAGAHGLAWELAHAPASGAVLIVGALGAASATVLVYRELPRAWRAWSGEA
jgi:hypothetical protein